MLHAKEHNLFDAKTVLEMRDKGEVVQFMFITPDPVCNIEAYGLIYANSDFTCEIFEGVTTSSNGTPADSLAVNTDRVSEDPTHMQIFQSPVVTNYGKRIWHCRTWESREPSGISNNYSILPKPNTKYVWKITKNISNPNPVVGVHFIDLDFWWKEVYGEVR